MLHDRKLNFAQGSDQHWAAPREEGLGRLELSGVAVLVGPFELCSSFPVCSSEGGRERAKRGTRHRLTKHTCIGEIIYQSPVCVVFVSGLLYQ